MLVCLFTTVGGVMLLVFCLIIVQECKLLYVWAVRRHNEEVAPPSYLEVTKPPSYSSCQPYNRFQQVEGRRRPPGSPYDLDRAILEVWIDPRILILVSMDLF